ncbi:carbohydrate ABC transporter substrate-binding protein, CUT1 family [Gracilibacillus orientalis]|uniref:Carbohydrate ABC transporter substrate-binding protein, CUT1 family n=1 Tax=Gracilibacillus orientalis TaxID=334253 RepID=A0A1I4JWG1_9BACI|nr:sugar ABC transporter substrate-binding protein [Gracilibacillus orientalis]SFL70436.1 carbohydrate ABC transporter substrate-binding protein, CUT1 family [Gracilibacillus orientalis]
MRKIKILVFVSFLFVIITLSACTSGDSSGDGQSDENTIQVWTMSDGLDDFVTDFEEESGITVDVQSIPWESAHDKLLTAVASGEGPDVLQIGTTWVAEFAEADTFMDISKYIDDYENLAPDNFYESAVGTTEFDGQTIGVPWYVDTRALFYRTDILEEVGYPNGPETWEDMIDASRKLADRGDDQYAIDLPTTDPQFPFILAWEQGWTYDIDKGADSFNSSDFKEAIELHHLFYDEGLSQMGEGKEFFQAFSDGSKAMFFSGPWDIGTVKDRAPEIEGKWDVKVMPTAENNKSMMGGAHLSVFANSEKVEQSLKFINWMAAPDTQAKWYETKSELPANKEAWENPVLADDDMVSTFGEQLEATQPLPLIPEYERLGNEILTTLEEINRGGAEIDQSLEAFRAEAAKILSE